MLDVRIHRPKERTTLASLTESICATKISDKQVLLIARKIKANRIYTKLDFSNYVISNRSIKNILHALKDNKTISALNLGGEIIDYGSILTLIKVLKRNKTLTDINFQSIGIEKYRGEKSRIEKFSIEKSRIENFLNGIFRMLKCNKTLISVYLGDIFIPKLSDAVFQILGKTLAQNSTLKSLTLSYVPHGVGLDALMKGLVINRTLESLNFSFGSIDFSDFNPIKTHHLNELLKKIGTTNTVIKLFTVPYNTERTFINILAKTTHLLRIKFLGISSELGDSLIELIKNNTQATQIVLPALNPDDEVDLKIFPELLPLLGKSTSLISLDLSENYIPEDSMMLFFKVLETNTTLKFLNLSKNSLDESLSRSLAKVLESNKVLIFLRVGWISVFSLYEILEVLKLNSTLNFLGFKYCPDYDFFFNLESALLETLKSNTTLLSIDIGGKYVSSDNFVNKLEDVVTVNYELALRKFKNKETDKRIKGNWSAHDFIVLECNKNKIQDYFLSLLDSFEQNLHKEEISKKNKIEGKKLHKNLLSAQFSFFKKLPLQSSYLHQEALGEEIQAIIKKFQETCRLEFERADKMMSLLLVNSLKRFLVKAGWRSSVSTDTERLHRFKSAARPLNTFNKAVELLRKEEFLNPSLSTDTLGHRIINSDSEESKSLMRCSL